MLGCRACASPGGGCQFLGTAGTSQVVGEALGMTLMHGALAPSGQEIWLDLARRSAEALVALEGAGLTMADIVTEGAVHNAMVVYAAFGEHQSVASSPCDRPRCWTSTADGCRVGRGQPGHAAPGGRAAQRPVGHPTARAYLAGGVPEVMLHLRALGLLDLDVWTVHGRPLGELLDAWEVSERRKRVRERLFVADGVDPDTVIIGS